jgi:cytochrome c oxidase cbb3-type subunit 3
MDGQQKTLFAAAGGLAALAVAVFVGMTVYRGQLAHRLVAAPSDTVASDPQLVRFAHQEAVPVFAKNCARCHGMDMKGNRNLGAPDLLDKVWLYDNGNVADVERTILYGVRSGHAKSRNIADMPAVGRLGVLSPHEIFQVVQYVQKLAKQPYQADAAVAGQALFRDKGNCFDCHAPDGTGNPDYGSTDFTANTWSWGGDYTTLFKSVRDGRHGRMDAFIHKLSAAEIRALAVDIYVRSHPATGQQVAANEPRAQLGR